MKKIFFPFFFTIISFISFAQDKPNDNEEEYNKGFQKQKLFTGGGVDVGFSTYNTVLGLNPVLGYSLTKWLDAGIVLNFVYSSSREYYQDGTLTGNKFRQTDFGP